MSVDNHNFAAIINIHNFNFEQSSSLSFENSIWKDLELELQDEHTLDLSGYQMFLVVLLQGPACNMRLALGQDQGLEPFANAAEYITSLCPGFNWFSFNVKNMRILRGELEFNKINRIVYGGESQNSLLNVFLYTNDGRNIFKQSGKSADTTFIQNNIAICDDEGKKYNINLTEIQKLIINSKTRKRKMKAEFNQAFQRTRKREIEICFNKCPSKLFENALELGAGDGFHSKLLSEYTKRLISTDLNRRVLNNQNHDNIEYEICDAEEVDQYFEEKKFDLIFSSSLLEHLPNPNKALSGMSKVLKNDGIIICMMPNQFWKFLNILLYLPDRIIDFFSGTSLVNKLTKEITNTDKNFDDINNLKTGKVFRNKLLSWFLAGPHGVSKSSLFEFYGFSKFKWKKEFKKAGLQIVKVKKGPVSSGYCFGGNITKKVLETLGFGSEFIYIVTKKGSICDYKDYF